jgi:hypothetical protein
MGCCALDQRRCPRPQIGSRDAGFDVTRLVVKSSLQDLAAGSHNHPRTWARRSCPISHGIASHLSTPKWARPLQHALDRWARADFSPPLHQRSWPRARWTATPGFDEQLRAPRCLISARLFHPISAKALALSLLAEAWQTITWCEGTADWLPSRFARQRVRPAHRDTLLTEPRAEEWLPIEWPPGQASQPSIGLPLCLLLIASKQLGRSPDAPARRRWQWPRPRWRDRGIGTAPGHIAHAEGADLHSQPRIVAVTGIHLHHTLRRPAVRAALFCSRTISGLVWNTIVSGTLAWPDASGPSPNPQGDRADKRRAGWQHG